MPVGVETTKVHAGRRLAPGARRAQLLDCAVSAFASMGLERATHAEVARLANVSVPTVFVYFPTREDLAAAVLGEVERFLDRIVGASMALRSSPEERLTALAQAFAHAADGPGHLIRVWLDWSTAVRADVWPAYLKVQERIVVQVACAVGEYRAGKPVKPSLGDEAAARMFVGSGHTVALMKLAGAPDKEVDGFIGVVVAATLART
jgi:TetR/AcrR family transcriptional regulator, hemagglutinin/protease regulatory protein